LAHHGARVILTDLPDSRLDEVTAKLLASGYDVACHPADITDEDSVAELVRFAVDTFGGIQILDNNAGATGYASQDGDVLAMDVTLWDRVAAINAKGPMLMCKHVVPVMIGGGGGSIVNISSGQSLSGDLANTAYSAGKAALNSL